ncbi:MAG: response regulator [Treponema sp.]|nr:response regulator [Treponema sp.]
MKSVLIVDDNLVSLKQISAQLAKNYDVSLAKSGELALQICAKERPDLILLDVEMPDMDGFETIARLKGDPHLKHVPVIFLTGNSDTATEIKCLESGAMDFITKPANADILHHRIELHLQFSTYQLHLEHVVEELEDNIGISFAELLDCKDHNVASHVLRTGEYVELLMKELLEEGTFGDELKAEDIDIIKRAIPFHDIGKIGVSDIILLKRTSLTEEEHQEICKHTLIGGHVLRTIYNRTPEQHYLKLAITIAEGHHEQYDGKGYPKGIKGDEIPLCCRIMSVANVYDACITDRIYRKRLSHEEACRAISDGRGTLFDPRVVDAFEKVKDKFAALNVMSKLSLIDKGWSVSNETNTGS